MVTRVTTPGNYSAVLTNLLAAQKRQMDAGNQVATQKNGQNLKDYAKSSELLTAMRTVQTRLGVFQDQGSLISDKLATQDATRKAKIYAQAMGIELGNVMQVSEGSAAQPPMPMVRMNRPMRCFCRANTCSTAERTVDRFALALAMRSGIACPRGFFWWMLLVNIPLARNASFFFER